MARFQCGDMLTNAMPPFAEPKPSQGFPAFFDTGANLPVLRLDRQAHVRRSLRYLVLGYLLAWLPTSHESSQPRLPRYLHAWPPTSHRSSRLSRGFKTDRANTVCYVRLLQSLWVPSRRPQRHSRQHPLPLQLILELCNNIDQEKKASRGNLVLNMV